MKIIRPLSIFNTSLIACLMSFSQFSFADTQHDTEKLDYQDVFELEYAASPVFHPKREMLVYERRSMDIMQDRMRVQLWAVDLSSKQHTPLLADEHSYTSPKFSPTGDRLAYLSAKSGSQQIYVHWLAQNRSAKLSNLQHSPSNITWSPDGKTIAFTMFTPSKAESLFTEMPQQPKGASWAGSAKYIDSTQYRSDGAGFNQAGNSQVYILSSEGGTPRQLTFGAYNHNGPLSFSKNGKSIFFSANRNKDWELLPLESDIYKVDIASSQLTKTTHSSGPESSPMLSPDGKYLAYQWVNDRKLSYQVNQIMLQASNSNDGSSESKANARSLTPQLDRQIGAMKWAKNSKGLYFSYIDKGKTKLAYVSTAGKLKTLAAELGSQALGRPYTSGEFAVSNDGEVVYTINNPQRPADLALMKKRGKPELLTQLNEDVFTGTALASVEKLPVLSSIDQLEIDAWIAYPPHFDKSKNYPIILEIHGGPHAAYASTFSMELQLMAAKGYITVWSNPRGSSSYGEDFGNLIHHNYPSQDYNDLMDVVDAAIAKGNVDTRNLFITGGSGGGVLTAWSIGKTDRFAAAVVAKPVINWLSFALTADAYPFFTQYWMEDMPWNISEKLWARSPLSLVGNVKTPTMLLTGEADYRTPMSETEQYYQALRLQKIPSAMVRIPGASHGIASRPSHLIQKVGNIVAWFDKYKSE
ncbi:S9 family peptidase [Glaciecola sp. MH2013]|uniref:S9 family peptidase n=1 Tax=Glaciecola sp. MH2013 TaxID=2785524 RepID=UPI00189D02CE|nr:S9 family peptidase [Glaciecola sp. MH2013]MBF7073075.1 S9 family peptidase [Glaciecola sp. MH2013]